MHAKSKAIRFSIGTAASMSSSRATKLAAADFLAGRSVAVEMRAITTPARKHKEEINFKVTSGHHCPVKVKQRYGKRRQAAQAVKGYEAIPFGRSRRN